MSDAATSRDRPFVRRARVEDAPAFARTMGDPAVFPQLLQLPFTDEAAWTERLKDMLSAPRPDLHLVAELDGEVVAAAGLHSVGPSLRRRHVMALGLGVAPPAQGRGVASTLMAALLEYADRWTQVLRIELTVYTDNARAIALYRKFGFEIEGTLRAYALRDGEYVDAYSMARLHPNPPVLR